MTVDDIALTLHRGLGPKGVAHLIAVLGSAQAVYAASEEELVGEAALRPDLARDIRRRTTHRQAEAEVRYMKRHGIGAVAATDAEYPPRLRDCPDPPHVLYFVGERRALGMRSVAVVGTRMATPYGQRMCDVLIGRLAELAPQTAVVSGLAYGIDGHAHRAALRYGLPTVAVVANVLPEVTPSSHRELARDIVAHGGAIVSELHSQTRQNGALFIPRNRIMAGMSEGTVVVESPVGGGALSTAELADGYGRTVMAVPGRAGDKCSAGANRLIMAHSAAMVCSGDDVVRELGWDIVRAGQIPERKPAAPLLDGDERRVLEAIGEGETVDNGYAGGAQRHSGGGAGCRAAGAGTGRHDPLAARPPLRARLMELCRERSVETASGVSLGRQSGPGRRAGPVGPHDSKPYENRRYPHPSL